MSEANIKLLKREHQTQSFKLFKRSRSDLQTRSANGREAIFKHERSEYQTIQTLAKRASNF